MRQWSVSMVVALAGLLAACSKLENLGATSKQAGAKASGKTPPRWDPTKTYAVIAGVLSWSDKSLAPFSKVERKDKELFDLLGARGVPASNRVLLLDAAATSQAVMSAVENFASKAEKGSTLIIYFAGHGVKTNDNKIVFASADINTLKLESTGIHLDAIAPLIKSKLKAERVVFLADCCYSGGLAEVAKAVSAGGLEAIALTSSESSNISTANWTFTQSVIDALKGRSIADHDGDGTITLKELEVETKAAMKFREGQRVGLSNHGVSDSLVLADAEKCPGCKKPELDRVFARGSYVTAKGAKGNAPARVLTADDATNKLSLAFYDYSHEVLASVGRSEAKPPVFVSYAVGSSLDVTWNGRTYEAKVLKADDGFHYVTYLGFPPTWDEWVTSARITGPHAEGRAARRVKVLWEGRFWDAVVVRQEGAKTCVHYVGFADAWDECVTKDRLKT